MTPFGEVLANDQTALELLSADIRTVTDAQLGYPTPCDGWTVRDLLGHMNREHVAICGGAVDPVGDPRAQFTPIAARWLEFFAGKSGAAVLVPKMGAELPAGIVLAAHFADMVIHRWDLAVALGQPCPTDAALVTAATTVAQTMTAPGSPLVGDGGVYGPSLAPVSAASGLDNLVRMYGRDHMWGRSRELN